jgi:endonuclease YncB( thermonuclease family)
MIYFLWALVTAVSLTWVFPLPTHGAEYMKVARGKVISVHDGDTVTFARPHGKPIIIRLANIDCPELKQPYGVLAKSLTEMLADGKDATVIITGSDRYGRKIGTVYVDGHCVNEELVKYGLAWKYDEYCNDLHYDAMQSLAKQERRGLWLDENPTPPWVWRQRHHTDKKMKKAKSETDEAYFFDQVIDSFGTREFNGS